MSGVDTVVTRARGEEHFRAAPLRGTSGAVLGAFGGALLGLTEDVVAQEMVRRMAAQEFPLLRLVGVAELGHPRRTGEEVRISFHIKQRDLAYRRTKELGGNGASDEVADH